MDKTISNALKSVAVDLVEQEDGSFREKEKPKFDRESFFDSKIFQDYAMAYSALFTKR